jgi:hypothetical protein
MEAEYNAVTCVAVYMLLMSFCQKGINKLRNHQEHMRMRHPDGDFVVSEGFDDGELGPPFLLVPAILSFRTSFLFFNHFRFVSKLHFC